MKKRESERITRRAEQERRIIESYLWREDEILMKANDWKAIMLVIAMMIAEINEGVFSDAEAIMRLLDAEEAMERGMWLRGLPRSTEEWMQGYSERNPMSVGDAVPTKVSS